MSKPRILLLSGYHAASHRYWCEQLVDKMPEFDWSVVSLPDRHFYWRVRSNAITFAYEHQELSHNHYDLIVATSMVDICNLKGLLPHLAGIPSVYYFHENQFAYPTREPNSNLINAQLTSVYSALSATQLVFNSQYNLDSFSQGVANLIDKMPDGISKELLDQLTPKSAVIPVPIQGVTQQQPEPKNSQCLEIVWNHRWEYDKQPEVFFNALANLAANNTKFTVHVMGQSFRKEPDCFAEFKQTHGAYIETWGYQSAEDYQRVLHRAHVVVSTALHDFQGLGMLEAMAAGCTPIAPNRMAYPEYVPKALLYETSDAETEAKLLCEKLLALDGAGVGDSIDVSGYHLDTVIPLYKKLFESLM